MKLIAGKQNIPYIVLKPNYATGAERLKPKRVKPVQPKQVFNELSLIYVLKKVA